MAKRHGNDDSGDLSGQDSFLDIVANIVGILILLVMVVGVRASHDAADADALSKGVPAPAPDASESERTVRQARRRALAARSDVADLVRQVVNVHQESQFRDEERIHLHTLVAAFEQEIQKRRSELNAQEQRDFDLRNKLAKAKQTLQELTREQVALVSQPPEVEQIESLPTPLAKSVSGNEVHLRLDHGRVAYIPLDELLSEFKEHAESNIWQLQDRNAVVSTVGPTGGFRLRYRLQKSKFVVRQGASTQQGSYVQLTRWQLLPVSDDLGEPVERALQPNSDLMHFLSRHPPETATVTVWAYPGSFNEFRALKEALFERGYSTAARPLPKGILIGGSPFGTKSAAQ